MATMSSLAQVYTSLSYERAEATYIDARLTMSGSSRSKRVACDKNRVANQLRMTARRVLEWIGMLRKAWLVFRYDLL